MGRPEALSVALELYLMPSGVRVVRKQPLAKNVDLVLAIAAGEPDALRQAMDRTKKVEADIRKAAGFYIEQILFAPQSNSYRVLGGDAATPTPELRRHLALLMKWLHPDVSGSDQRRALSLRVTEAWETLKTPERRSSYDTTLAATAHRDHSGSSTKARSRMRPEGPQHRRLAHLLRRRQYDPASTASSSNGAGQSLGAKIIHWFRGSRGRFD